MLKKKKELHVHLHLGYRILDETIYQVIRALFILFLRLVEGKEYINPAG